MLHQSLAALAEPNRFRIVDALRTGPSAVADLGARVSLGQPQVSKHLKVLRDCGLVRVYPRGQQRLYALSPEPFAELNAWLGGFEPLWRTRFDQIDDLLETLQAEPNKDERDIPYADENLK